jgi:hypothetical protein
MKIHTELWRGHPVLENARCGVHFNKQGHIRPIIVEGALTNHYLKQLLNEVILVIQGAGHVDTLFSQKDVPCPHTLNVILHGQHNVFAAISCQIAFQSTTGVGGPGNHVHWM